MAIELLVYVAVPLEYRGGGSPRRRLRVCRIYICRDLSAWKKPDFYEVTVPLCSVDTASIGIESRTPRVGAVVMGLASLVCSLPESVDEAVL